MDGPLDNLFLAYVFGTTSSTVSCVADIWNLSHLEKKVSSNYICSKHIVALTILLVLNGLFLFVLRLVLVKNFVDE